MKRVPILITLILLIVPAPALTAAAPKVGSECKRTGQTKTFNSQEFICKKKGKKLLWSKSAPLKSASAEVAKPTPSATPSNNPIPTTQKSSTPAATAPIQPSGSAEQLKALSILKERMKPGPSKRWFRYYFSPKAVPSFRDFIVSNAERSMSYWSEVYDNPDVFNVFYATHTELDWVLSAWKEAGFSNDYNFGNELRQRLAQEGDKVNAGSVPNRPDSSYLIFFRGAENTIQLSDYSFIPHETAHIVQQYVSKNRKGQMPCWVREGTANLFGNFMAVEFHGMDYNALKRNDMNNYRYGSSGIELRNFNENEWLSHLNSLDRGADGACAFTYRFAYGSGLLLSELLIADYGFNKMIDFWRSFEGNAGFRSYFKDVYGIELEEWFKSKAIPYLMKEYARVK